MEVVTATYAELAPDLKAQLQTLAEAEFGAFPIVRETTWATPDRSYIGLVDGQVACFYNLVLREVCFDGLLVAVAGLNNLITTVAFRARGLASRLLRETEADWFGQHSAQCGLLLCASALLPFYSRLGWHAVRSEVRFAQPNGDRIWAANCMLLLPDRSDIQPIVIDLCGLTW